MCGPYRAASRQEAASVTPRRGEGTPPYALPAKGR